MGLGRLFRRGVGKGAAAGHRRISSSRALYRPGPSQGRRALHDLHTVQAQGGGRSEEHTSELQSLMRISYAVFCLKKKNKNAIKAPVHQSPYQSHTTLSCT